MLDSYRRNQVHNRAMRTVPIAVLIETIRARYSLNYTQIARLLGVNTNDGLRWRNGYRTPRTTAFAHLWTLLAIDDRDFIHRLADMPKVLPTVPPKDTSPKQST